MTKIYKEPMKLLKKKIRTKFLDLKQKKKITETNTNLV